MIRPLILPAGPGQESVWDYPRPPRLEATGRRLRVEFAGVTLAETTAALRVLETSHPPVYYFPPGDVRLDLMPLSADNASDCEWKGQARYFDVVVGTRRAARVAWAYAQPESGFAAIANHVAFYPGRVDACTVDGVSATPQPGNFYGGWITPDVVGPFKGGPGTRNW